MNSFWVTIFSVVLCVHASSMNHDAEWCENAWCDSIKDYDLIFPNFPTDALGLMKRCREDEPKVSCIVNIFETCPDEKPLFIPRDFVIAAGKLVSRVCYGDLRAKFLRKTKCFGDVWKNPPESCDKIGKGEGNNTCPNAVKREECFSAFVKRTCGREAVDMFLEIYNVAKLLFGDPCASK